MVEFSIFYFFPPPPLFLYDLPEDTSYVSAAFHFAQIDRLTTSLTPKGMPIEYSFPVSFKISNGMRSRFALYISGDWSFYLALPSVHASTPPLGTSALPGNPPEVVWRDINTTIDDTLKPLEVRDLKSKVPVQWRVKGRITIVPLVSSESNFTYIPVTFGFGKKFGNFFLGVEGNVSRFSGKGGWNVEYSGGVIYYDSLKLSGVQNDAALSLQFGEKDVGRYVYSFDMEPTLLYNLGFRMGKEMGGWKVSLGAETFKDIELRFSDSLYYDYISDLVGNWRRKGFVNNNLYAEYSSDSDTVYLKGDAIVEIGNDSILRMFSASTSSPLFEMKGGFHPFLLTSYAKGSFYITTKLSTEGFSFFGRLGDEYGGTVGLDMRFARLLSRWEAGLFYSSEGFIFSFKVSRAFGKLDFPYLNYDIPALTKTLYAYSFGFSVDWKLRP